MKADDLHKLAADSRFIPGIYNYCDRWCERCSLSNRCMNFAMQQAEGYGDLTARDLSNQKFWDRLQQSYHAAVEMLRTEAKARGVDLDDPKLRLAAEARIQAEHRQTSKNQPVVRAAMAYAKAVDRWLGEARPLLEAKLEELKTEVVLEIGDPQAEVMQLTDFTEIIKWYQYFIFVKLRRAVDSQASEELPPAGGRSPKDSDGSAKIALIGLDRSIAAWSGLRTALGADEADGILDLLAQLAALRRETEKLFPNARAFVRPGFD
ncbi:MAG TPA: hypothetical protein VF988_06145 [Verrucomicrobiae bacterium]